MTREVMQVCRVLRDSDLPLMTRAVEAGKAHGEFWVSDLFHPHERSRAVEAMRLSGMFELITRREVLAKGRPRLVAVWRG